MGRLPSGEPAAVIEAERRVSIGSGVSGPGTALWVEAEEIRDPAADNDEVRKLASDYKALVIATLQRRDAWQVIDTVNRSRIPPRWPTLPATRHTSATSQKRELAGDP